MNRKPHGMIMLCFSIFILLFFVGNICPLEHIVGIPCPGCNMFTACYWLLQGNLDVAQYYHPAILAVIVYGVVAGICYVRYRGDFTKTKLFKYSTYLFLFIFLGVYLYRMFTIFPQYPMQFNQKALLPTIFHLF